MTVTNEKLETKFIKNKRVSFIELQRKLKLSEIALRKSIVNFMIVQIKNFDFKTPYKDNKYLRKTLICLNKKGEISYEEKKELIKDLEVLKKAILDKLLNSSLVNRQKEAFCLNEKLLYELLDEVNYTILLFKHEFNRSKVSIEIKENETELYELLDYVIFVNQDINVFKKLIKGINYLDTSFNNAIVLKVMDNYFNSLIGTNDSNQNYWQEILETFLLSSKQYLKLEDLSLLLNRIEKFINKNKKVLEDKNSFDDIKLLYKKLYFPEKKEMDLDLFKETNRILTSFPYDVSKEMNNLAYPLKEQFTDLTNKELLSIDIKGAKLKENVFSFDFLEEGYLLTLYVPAITSYIKKGSLMEQEAYQRGIMTFKSDLFPREFLYDKCSFEQNKDRYAFAYEFYFNQDFHLVDIKAKKVIINVDVNLNYQDVLTLIQDNSNDWVNKQLFFLKSLSQVLTCPNNTDFKYLWDFIINTNYMGNDKDIENIVNNLTICANQHMANYFVQNDLPFIFRNNGFKDDLTNKLINNNELIYIFDKLQTDSYFSSYNQGHNVLKKDAYCQISTPCRNYAAYICQRLIELFLINDKKIDVNEKRKWEKELEVISKHLNNRSKINEEYLDKLNGISKIKRR